MTIITNGMFNIGAGFTAGLVWPFTDWFWLYADGMLEIGYFGAGIEGLIAPIISPSVIASAAFGRLGSLIIQYTHTWHKDRIVQSVSAGFWIKKYLW